MDRKRARNWYWWLWLSPLLTVPTLVFLLFNEIGFDIISRSSWRGSPGAYYDTVFRITILIAVLGSALWHLILLIPALDKARPFVRWHGRQALLLVGVRTAIPLAFGLALGEDYLMLLVAVPALVLVLFGGTLWGQLQAARGKCSLMWSLGREEPLSTLREGEAEVDFRKLETEALVEIIRFSRDPDERQSALTELQVRGMVEIL